MLACAVIPHCFLCSFKRACAFIYDKTKIGCGPFSILRNMRSSWSEALHLSGGAG